jgi:uncharacterized membrane protein YphA (DoxX/SURF4 family)
MDTALWIAQGFLAVAFALAGLNQLVRPYERLAEELSYVNDFPPRVIRVIGAIEVLGAIGVVVPWLTGILPWLTPLAAIGLVLEMSGAVATHIRRREYSHLWMPLLLIVPAVFVAYGRGTAFI